MNRQPWERRERETLQAFEAFTTYLTLGPERSCRRAAEVLGKSEMLMQRWSRKHEWQLRLAAYEEHFALRALGETEDQRIELMQEHLSFASTVLRKSRALLDHLVDKMPETTDEILEAMKEGKIMTVDQALRAGDLAVKVGRLATGLDGKYTPSTAPTTDLSNLEESELDEMERLLDKAKGVPNGKARVQR